MSEETLQIGQRVELTGKNVKGAVAYFGATEFATGIWVGVVLDEPKGKNNGAVQDKRYFECKDNCGVFVRPTQIVLLDEMDNPIEKKSPRPASTPRKLVEPKTRLSQSSSKPQVTGVKRKSMQPTNLSTSSSRLSLASSRQSLAGSRQSLSGSRTQLASPAFEKQKSDVGLPQQNVSNIPKRSSFVETGFLETLKTQFTPGQALMSPAAATAEDKVSNLQLLQEIETLKNKNKDFAEQIETLKLKRKEDKDKMKDYEKMKIQLEHLSEFKSKIMESQAMLQKELQRAKQEAREAIEAKETHAEEMADLAETVEMATLDKEMAEEKAEILQRELDVYKEKIEELNLDLEILKTEMQNKVSNEGDISTYEYKQLEQQNIRLRDTLVKMRDLAAHNKHEYQKLMKDVETKKAEIAELAKAKEKFNSRVAELENQISDLQEQADAALGAEEMVVLLGEQKLTLEDRVKELQEEVSELEALQEMNDQLVESNAELEMDLREELDLAHAATREAQRERDAALETITDRDQTIKKFRDLVQKLQDQALELQSRLEKESSKPVSALPEILDFKKMFTETKAHTKAIDLELRKIDVQQSQEHIKFLTAYMPDTFMTRGGDHDAILVLLLIPRLLFKIEILLSQIRDKFPSVDKYDRTDIVKGHSLEQHAFKCRLSHFANFLQAILHQYFHSLNTCSPETFLKVGASHTEMAAQERTIDNFVDLLKRDQLDENVSIDPLEKCVNFFNTMYPLLLGTEQYANQSTLVRDYAKSLHSAFELIVIESNATKCMMQSEQKNEMDQLIDLVLTSADTIQQQIKTIKRRLPTDKSVLSLGLSKNTPELLIQCNIEANKVAKTMHEIVRLAVQFLSTSGEVEKGIPDSKVKEFAIAASDKIYEQDDLGPIQSIKTSLNAIQTQISQLAQHLQDNEFEILSSKKEEKQNSPPVMTRSQIIKKELGEIKNLISKLETKEGDIKELKKMLKAKSEELSEMNIRKELAEKKLGNVNKDYEMTIEKLQRKIDELQNTIQRKEKEFEKTLDSLQTDIDSLESEKGELRDKLKKKAYIEEITKSTSGSQLSSLVSPTLPAVVKDSPMLLQEIQYLKQSVDKERKARMSLEAAKLEEVLDSLKPLPTFKKSKNEHLSNLTKEATALKNDLLMTLATPKIIDLTNRKPGTNAWLDKVAPRKQLADELSRIEDLRQKAINIQLKVLAEVSKNKPGGQVKADIADFPTVEMAKALKETEPIHIGEISIISQSIKSAETIPLVINHEGLKNILNRLVH